MIFSYCCVISFYCSYLFSYWKIELFSVWGFEEWNFEHSGMSLLGTYALIFRVSLGMVIQMVTPFFLKAFCTPHTAFLLCFWLLVRFGNFHPRWQALNIEWSWKRKVHKSCFCKLRSFILFYCLPVDSCLASCSEVEFSLPFAPCCSALMWFPKAQPAISWAEGGLVLLPAGNGSALRKTPCLSSFSCIISDDSCWLHWVTSNTLYWSSHRLG